MKYIFGLLVNVMMLSCTTTAQSNKDVDATTFQEDLSKENIQLLDVRTDGEYNNGHIKNAMLADWTNPQIFTERVKYLDKSKPVMVYCASGIRSGAAAKWLTENGYTTVENLKGGFTQWKIENKPYEGASNIPQINEKDYAAYVTSANIVLMEFGAEWCPPCRTIAPVINEIQTELKDKIKVVKVDGGVNTNMMQLQSVNALPTFIVYKNGKEVWRKKGVVEKSELLAQLN